MPSLESMPATHRHAIEEGVELIEKRSGSKIPEGSNPAVTPMLLTIDDVHISFRPFLWYIFVALGHFLAHKFFEHHWDVKFDVHGDVEYMVRIPENWDPANSKTAAGRIPPWTRTRTLSLQHADYHPSAEVLGPTIACTYATARQSAHIPRGIRTSPSANVQRLKVLLVL
jgi:hypothetical protein